MTDTVCVCVCGWVGSSSAKNVHLKRAHDIDVNSPNRAVAAEAQKKASSFFSSRRMGYHS